MGDTDVCREATLCQAAFLAPFPGGVVDVPCVDSSFALPT
jgi:hypothetical protein